MAKNHTLNTCSITVRPIKSHANRFLTVFCVGKNLRCRSVFLLQSCGVHELSWVRFVADARLCPG